MKYNRKFNRQGSDITDFEEKKILSFNVISKLKEKNEIHSVSEETIAANRISEGFHMQMEALLKSEFLHSTITEELNSFLRVVTGINRRTVRIINKKKFHKK